MVTSTSEECAASIFNIEKIKLPGLQVDSCNETIFCASHDLTLQQFWTLNEM